MRRTDRQVTDFDELKQIVGQCDVCRLGLCDGGLPYVVPMNFGFSFDGGALTLYFHGAGEGKKLDMIRKNPNACFEMDCGHELVEGKAGCDWSMRYASVIGYGKVEFVEEAQDKADALSKIMEHYAGRADFTFDSGMLRRVTVLRLTADAFTGKRYR